jgi:hypothetical protein
MNKKVDNKETKTNTCTIQNIVRNTENVNVAIKHFEKRMEDYEHKRLSGDEVLKVLRFLKQANEQALDIIGIGCSRYDGGDIKDITTENIYEGGFIVKKKYTK